MLISIIIPVYNVEKYIERCLRSIINQNFNEPIECIIVNDATPDKSMIIIQNLIKDYYGSIFFKIINHSKNRGLAAARNTGLENSTGTYILNIDGDDYCEPNLLEELIKKIKENQADIIGFDFYKDYGNYKIQDAKFKFHKSTAYNLSSLINGEYSANIWRRIIKRKLYIDNNIRLIEGINMAEDVMATIQLHYYAESVDYIDKPLYNYIQFNNASLVHNISVEKINETFKAYRFIENFLKSKGIFETYKVGFYKRCIIVKLPFLLNNNIQSYSKWMYYYPEAAKYISSMDLTFKLKMFLKLIDISFFRNTFFYIQKIRTKYFP